MANDASAAAGRFCFAWLTRESPPASFGSPPSFSLLRLAHPLIFPTTGNPPFLSDGAAPDLRANQNHSRPRFLNSVRGLCT